MEVYILYSAGTQEKNNIQQQQQQISMLVLYRKRNLSASKHPMYIKVL